MKTVRYLQGYTYACDTVSHLSAPIASYFNDRDSLKADVVVSKALICLSGYVQIAPATLETHHKLPACEPSEICVKVVNL